MKLTTAQIKQLKEIITEIANEEKKKVSVDYDIEILTVIEYYKSLIFKKKLSLHKIYMPIWANGFHNLDQKNIGILIHSNTKLSFPEKLVEIIKTTFHEMRHAYQYNCDESSDEYQSYLDFVIKFEEVTRAFETSDYKNKHDQYFFEIDANVYGVNKAFEYLEEKNLLTEENRKFLELMKIKYEFDLVNFDIQKLLKKFHEICRTKEVSSTHWFMQIFYTENLRQFKSISEILSNPDINRIDKKILRDILSSEHFIASIDFSVLTEEEINVVLNALNETIELQIERRIKFMKFFQDGILDNKNWLILDVSTSSRISAYSNVINKITNFKQQKFAQIELPNESTKIVEEENLEYKTNLQ